MLHAMGYFLARGSRPDSTFYAQCGKRSKILFTFFFSILFHSVSRAITVIHQKKDFPAVESALSMQITDPP